MNPVFPAAHFELPIARSDFIDAHNAADAAVRRLLAVLNVGQKQLLSQNIDTLEKVAANPQYSKQRKAKVDILLAELRGFQAVRCDIVHGRMEVLMVDGSAQALFGNVQRQPPVGVCGLLLTLEQIKGCTARLSHIAIELSRPLVPAPPKPAASE